MTIHDNQRFRQAFNRLAVATRLPADQADAAMQRIYFEGLERFAIEAVEDAARTIAEQAEWFPKLAEWRDAADKATTGRALERALPASRREWHAECGTCEDSGWEVLACDGPDGGPRQCHRCAEGRGFYPHTYAVVCSCRETNHTYQRQRAEVHAQAVSRAAAVKA